MCQACVGPMWGYEPDFFLQSGQRFLSIPPCHAPHFVHLNVAAMGRP